MSFDLEERQSVIVHVTGTEDELVGIELEDGNILYTDRYSDVEGQFVYPIDLLPEGVRLELRASLEGELTAEDTESLDEALQHCWVTHWDSYSLQSNLRFDSRARGVRIEIGQEIPSLDFFSSHLGKRGKNGFGDFRFESPVKRVFLTSRTELAKD